LLCKNLEEVPVQDLGRRIRFHEAFSPAGTNVNFIDVTDPHHISIRTYERGVEDETLACGTGAVASALASSALDLVDSPVFLRTREGEVLVIYFQREGWKFSEVLMEGNTAVTYEGELWEEALI
jgi:diaminopimelate epimerase